MFQMRNKIIGATIGLVSCSMGYFLEKKYGSQPWKKRYQELDSKVSASISEKKFLEEENQQLRETFKWNDNWDFRASKKPKSGARRTIILVRHGQYHDRVKDADERTLTDLGKTQAEETAKRLKEFGYKFDKIIISTMIRATQTGEIIAKHFPDVDVEYSGLIEEGFPAAPRPPLKGWELEDDPDHPKEAARMKEGFEKYIHRAEEHAEGSECVVLVCHGNVIRSFICRALQIPVEYWLRFGGDNGAITILSCSASGSTSLWNFGDTGFMPVEMLTYSTSEDWHFKNRQEVELAVNV